MLAILKETKRMKFQKRKKEKLTPFASTDFIKLELYRKKRSKQLEKKKKEKMKST